MSLEVIRWSEAESLSIQLLEKLYERPKFRVSPMKYEPGVNFDGFSHKGLVFILGGACKIDTKEGSVVLSRDQYFEKPKGKFTLTVTSSTELSIVNVWDVEKIIEQNT